MTIQTTPELDTQQRDDFVSRMTASMLGLVDIVTMYLGDRLGLYAALASHGPLTSTDLAARTGTQERYVREWLEQQAVSGVLEVDDVDAPAEARRYVLPRGNAEALLDSDSLSYIAPMARIFISTTSTVPKLLHAFKHGGGFGWSDLGADAREGQAQGYRPVYMRLLGREW